MIYAVGDVHGRLDLLSRMVEMIREDVNISVPRSLPMLVFLGDLIDRGPDSAGCLGIVLSLKAEGWCEVVCIRGNHEHSMLQFVDEGVGGAAWCAHGGGATLASYGVDLPAEPSDSAWKNIRWRLSSQVPGTHWDLLRSMPLWATCEDYLFVHAGVRPGTPLKDQDPVDLLWIRQPFLKARWPADRVVVHGHTVLAAPELKPWRIGVDTGAYLTGVLTAVRLHGYERSLLQT
ncbi:metallophosphoesterase family protein [Caulobacter sp. DWP3-1-3b2]|uniref:metallophosphoesterase family protein n=1 Tax=Caulobacter sp. DWP3-1-3b2 TaxID=2804643 RepID=UPI003CF8B39C